MERALALYAQVLARKFGVNIEWRESGTAATDGKTIYVDPRYRSIGTAAQAATLFGLIAHETGHLRLTDFSVLKQEGMTPLLHSLHNILEDVWMEREFTKTYPSVWSDIVESMINMRQMGLYGPPGADHVLRPAGSLFAGFVLSFALGRHYELEDFAKDAGKWCAVAVKRFGDDVVKRAQTVIRAVDNVNSTGAAMDLARQLLALLQEKADTSNEEQAAQGKGAGQQQEARNAAQALQASEKDLQSVHTEKGDALKEGVQKDAPGGGHGSQLSVGVRSGRLLREEGYTLPEFEGQRSTVRASLAGRLERLLEASVNIDVEYRRSGGRMDSRLLPAIRLGRQDVFVRRDDGEAIDTAVTIALDGSGSMRDIWAGALSAAYAAMDVMRSHSVAVALDVFSGSASYSMHTHDQPWTGMRESPFILPGGGTPTGAALNVAASVLVQRSEARKIVLLVTDGGPDNLGQAIAVTREAQGAGVDVAHVFIGGDGAEYEEALRANRLGRVGRCLDSRSGVTLAKAIEEALVAVMAGEVTHIA
ncbi:VWA domain-containing protein [Hydrogenophaga aromaticivorans]|uniref:VWA domain-containing protein n=1 Tax=Hydrogenophaga aromaticivorans TaxID=2610898 RepID=UPI001B371FF1|nr:VWA domain-containing protein [Hydrogenophaga aromaticivorans]MBQ0918274.1 VWA domain-containing protein [Hydrogenophaga aromaticivorans]